MAQEEEYPEDARFAWDMIDLTDAECEELVAYADAGMIDEADAVADRAANRMFGMVQ